MTHFLLAVQKAFITFAGCHSQQIHEYYYHYIEHSLCNAITLHTMDIR